MNLNMGVQNVCQKIEESFANGTNDREAHPKFWIAALVQMNCERKAEAKLNKLGYETFLPIQKEEHQWSDRRKIIDRIVIPMVIFIRISPKEDKTVRNYSFIYKLITLPGTNDVSTPIPDEQIDNFRFLLKKTNEKVVFDSTVFSNGDEVVVDKGNLKGLKGFVLNGDNNTIYIQIDMLGCAKLKIEQSYLKRIP